MNTSMYFNKPLQQDNIFVSNEVVSLADLAGKPTRKGLENAIISNGKLVNVVSKTYGHLPNESFFLEVERRLIEADIQYNTRSINRDDRSFVTDYILSDDSYQIDIKNNFDTIVPMLRFTNSYDGSNKTSGHFGFFRKVCSNGLHVAETKIGFSVRHKGDICNIVLPEIGKMVRTFIDNEYYTLRKKFEVLAETPIKDLSEFVPFIANKLDLFKYESSEKNPEPSLNARLVLDTINRESILLRTEPNAWIGYNAFNEVLHNKLKRNFENQRKTDVLLFEAVQEYALN